MQGNETWVHKGSILQTLLYTYYTQITDLPLNIQEANLLLFEYDINLLVNERDESILQHEMKIVMEDLQTWFRKNNLTTKKQPCPYMPDKI